MLADLFSRPAPPVPPRPPPAPPPPPPPAPEGWASRAEFVRASLEAIETSATGDELAIVWGIVLANLDPAPGALLGAVRARLEALDAGRNEFFDHGRNLGPSHNEQFAARFETFMVEEPDE